MSAEITPQARPKVSSKRIWFGFAAAFFCWWGLGITDVMITWRECLHHEQFGTSSSHPGLLWLNIGIFLALLIVAVVAGITSYRNWRTLSGERGIFSAEAHRPYEYLAMMGVLMTLMLTVGIIWFGLPLFIIQLCARIR